MSIVVARMPEHMDLFLPGSDGIYTIWWDQNVNNGQWNGWLRVAPFIGGPTGAVPTAGNPTVIARMAQHLDVFIVGKDGGIYSTWWDVSSGWANTFRIGNNFSVPITPGVPVTAVARMPEQLDLFTVGKDGGVYSTWWNSSSGWANWFRIDASFSVSLTNTQWIEVTAVARMPEHLDLFTIGTDGGIYSTWWDQNINNGQWSPWFRIGENFSVRDDVKGKIISAVARMPEHLDLFVVGADGGIYSTWWDGSSGWANWFRIGTLNASSEKDFPPASVAALARMPEQLDLFTESGGGIYSAAWDSSRGWTNWFRIDGDVGEGTFSVTAVTRMPQHLDLFSFDLQGNLYQSWWDVSSGWSAWSAIAGTFF